MSALDIFSRILHILAAITMMGGTIFTLLVFHPAASKLGEEAHRQLRDNAMKIWRQVVGAAIGLLIATGFYNYLVVTLPNHRGDGHYNMLMGIKILLAFVVFFLASVIPGRAKAFDWMRRNLKASLSVTILLAIMVVSIAGYLKTRGVVRAPAADTAVEAPAE